MSQCHRKVVGRREHGPREGQPDLVPIKHRDQSQEQKMHSINTVVIMVFAVIHCFSYDTDVAEVCGKFSLVIPSLSE